MRWLLVLVVAATGCNAILGLSPTHRGADAAPGDGPRAGPDAPCVPIVDGLECTDDACAGGAPINPPVTAGTACATGVCDGDGACVACVKDADCGPPAPDACTMPACVDHACTTGPAPRDTLCNGGADQCDGAGKCVDCTTNAGCGDCCACTLGDVCVPV